jgi:hypothetical protein
VSGRKCSDAPMIDGAGVHVKANAGFVSNAGFGGGAAAAAQAVPPTGDRHRNRKKWRPQSEHRNGERIQLSDFSTALREPTPLNSIDLQLGQCGVDIMLVGLNGSLRRAARSARGSTAGAARGDVHVGSIGPVARRTARFAGGLNLLRRPHVRFGNLHMAFSAGNFTFMSLQ